MRRIEFQDGRCLTVEGGDAKTIAAMLSNDYIRQGPVAPVAGKTHQVRRPAASPPFVRNLPVESPLPLPTMNFANPAHGPGPDEEPLDNDCAPPAAGDREEPLGVPTMRF